MEPIKFAPKARIIRQLGDQLIRSESIALLEIIKNSYDACATVVEIKMTNIEFPKLGEISIIDDGFGMNYEIIKDVWLQPGTTFKKNQIDDKNFISPCGRMPLGEKGIGRFGVHKLGEEIELVSKKAGESEEAYLKINWEDFDNDDLLENVPIQLIKRPLKEFSLNEHGTKIKIKNLRTPWTRGGIRELYRSINSLNSPFESLNSFKVKFKLDKQEWLSGLLNFKDVEDNALFEAETIIEGNKITNLEYKFKPWPSMKEIKFRTHIEKDITMSHKVYDEKLKKRVLKDIDLSDYKIGKIKFKILIYDLDVNILSMGVQDKKGLKEYLKLNGGVRVYREGIRIYDYGEPGNDWLSMDLDRINFPTARISNNIVIGAIQLDRLQSKDLTEKTNREGFIENDAFREFLNAIRFAINRIITQRNIDKDKLRNNYSTNAKKVPVSDNLDILKEKIENSIPDSKEKNEILELVKEIQSDYKTISEVYIRSASAGLSLSIVVHEIEKIIQELLYVVESDNSNSDSQKIKNLTWHLGKLIDGYSGLIRRRSRKESDLNSIIVSALWNIEFRLKAHGITIVKAFENSKAFETKVKCSDSLIIGTIVNIVDNSIWWLNYGKVQDKRLYIDISNELNGYLTILIADNGPNFTIPTEDVIKPFISNKEGGIGMGLHIAYEIMNSHGGELIFPDANQFSIPNEFHSGAIVGLAFKL